VAKYTNVYIHSNKNKKIGVAKSTPLSYQASPIRGPNMQNDKYRGTKIANKPNSNLVYNFHESILKSFLILLK
jgi:hypothetical protein